MSFRRTSDCENGRQLNSRRKYSFPNLRETTYSFRPVERLQNIRKVRSTSDTTRSSRKVQEMTNLVQSDLVLLNELVRTIFSITKTNCFFRPNTLLQANSWINNKRTNLKVENL